MVFKRRERRSPRQFLTEFVYPKGGWRRAAQYIQHRVQRLPDEPHRIARGVFAGSFVSFTPLFGFHFLSAALLAWVMRGNILAALLATFIGNPLTTPLIAITSVELGHWMLGIQAPLTIETIGEAFLGAGTEIWANIWAIFTPAPTGWHQLSEFFHFIFLPYLVGGILPGILISAIFYYLTIPLIRAYQKIRANKARERSERRRALRAGKAARMEARRSDDAPRG